VIVICAISSTEQHSRRNHRTSILEETTVTKSKATARGDQAGTTTAEKVAAIKRRNGCCRIVVTGGPGGGKTTAADLFRREIGERVVVVPEAATMLFQGGFPRTLEPSAQRASQRAIYHVQRNLEDVQVALFPERVLLCDRGTVDGAAYWPGPPVEFFNSVGTTFEQELARYDAAIFFESAAVGGISIESGNPVRNEDTKAACALDASLRALWSKHPHFVFVPHNLSFFKKITFGLASLESIVAQLDIKNHVA
jgi:predicted ATPase